MIKFSAYFLLAFFLFCPGAALAAEREEVQRKDLALTKALDQYDAVGKAKKKGLVNRVSVSMGYETNADLSLDRKGDVFKAVSFSTAATKNFSRLWSSSLRYDIYSQNFSEITDNSYLLNNVSASLARKVFFGHLGIGSDLAFVYYPRNAEGDFFYSRGFAFARQNITKKIYHQWDVEVSLRNYRRDKAISDALATLQNSVRRDKQAGAGYQVWAKFGERTTCFLKGKFSKSDGNSHYQDYYDYSSFRGDLGFFYELTKKDYLISSLSLTQKWYASRLTIDGTERQESDLYTANIGLKHLFSDVSALLCSYRYMQNVSNEPAERYSDSMVTVHWAYNF